MRFCYILFGIVLLLVGTVYTSQAQIEQLRGAGNRFGGGAVGKQSGKGDSVQHRTGFEDSITIRYRYLDSTRLQSYDSSLSDFTRRIPVPWTYVHLGNLGTAARNLLFTPMQQPGWDHGFHAFDIYNFNVKESRFYNTTRPYTELGYLLGSRQEQLIKLLHTQNLKPNWNMSFEYRLINSPGYFQNQGTNHNNYRFTSWYQTKNKRYQNFVVIVGNKLQAGENGGIKTDANYLDSSSYEERFTIPTQLGGDDRGNTNPFQVSINTGSLFTNATYLLRQQYDIGQKDSMIVNDTTVVPLFYPRLRLEHTIAYSTYKYRFKDYAADSMYYEDNYGIHFPKPTDSFFIQDFWKELVNDFSFYTFPDAKNAQQFFKAGASLQTLQGSFDSGRVSKNYYNFFLHGEYRNKTRNQKWDIEASGNFYVNGINAGDYNAYASLKGLISPKLGYLQLGFQNTNRTPSFVFDPASSFYLYGTAVNFKKENNTSFFGTIDQPRLKLKLSAAYHLITNYTYFKNFYEPDQFTTLFNLLNISVEKQFIIHKGLNLKTWVIFQQRIGDAPVNVPQISTRNQLGYDGTLGFKNLRISFGLEMRYFTKYKAPNYSPLTGQYFFQDATNVRMKLPDLAGYLHFRIKSFAAYVRAENVNSLDLTAGKFLNNNVPTLNYPYPGMQIRVGIFWSFVN